MTFPDPRRAYPVTLPDGSDHQGTVFLNQVIDNPGWEVGDYTYASDFSPVADWAAHLAPYLFGYGPEKLRIGRYCQIAHGVRFITSGANHAMDGLSTFPFPIFDPAQMTSYQPDSRDTVIGHDVWLGYGAIVCPGARIGNGVIVGAGAVVRGHVPDYAMVAGNPGDVVRMRFSEAEIHTLNALAWWDWPADRVAAAVPALLAGDVTALKQC
ncbi:CatB-related O-acetyltransferase [Tateyamaria omphalii]|uniref:Acetyltransferase n=1 Tax=Tateyamaria omphalii TaxID=299262 RepID=A0A1P8MVK5_9RHOB|nr:CatB-related O-acetyltransferase [Tateyamaria omphalii]APX12051.1 acetyltransferase [Tateyamaria omphalii]